MQPDITQWEELLEKIAARLIPNGHTIVTCESCTGGLLGTMLTHLPGSSRFYRGGIIPYATPLKEQLLAISENIIAKHGVVSAIVAQMMARQCADLLKADYAIAITGVAGPDGGSAETPVGTIWCGFHGLHGEATHLLRLGGDRATNRSLAAYNALLHFDLLLGQRLI